MSETEFAVLWSGLCFAVGAAVMLFRLWASKLSDDLMVVLWTALIVASVWQTVYTGEWLYLLGIACYGLGLYVWLQAVSFWEMFLRPMFDPEAGRE